MTTRSAYFTNWTNEPFDGYWNGRKRTFQPGDSVRVPELIARNWATALTNRELVRVKRDEDGRMVREKAEDGSGRMIPVYIIPDGDKYTSPKFPEQVPIFYDMFVKGFQLTDEPGPNQQPKDELDLYIESANAPLRPEARGIASKPVQVVNAPDDDEFEGQPNQ